MMIFSTTQKPHIVGTSPKMSHFLNHFYPIKSDLSGNTVSPPALAFQKLAKVDLAHVVE